MAEYGDPRLMAWLLQQLHLHPKGIIPASVAARACGCTREGLMHATRKGKLRLLAYKRPPWPVYFVPIEDVVVWQKTRRNFDHTAKLWDRLLPHFDQYDEYRLLRDAEVVLCYRCGNHRLAAELNL